MSFIITMGTHGAKKPDSITGPFKTQEAAEKWLEINHYTGTAVIVSDAKFTSRFPAPDNDEILTIPFPR